MRDQKTIFISFSIFSGFASLLVSCGEKPIESAQQKSVVEPNSRWTNNSLKACFLKTAKFSASEKEIISKAIMTEYTPERTGISYSGFETCLASEPISTVKIDLSLDKTQIISFGASSILDRDSKEEIGLGVGQSIGKEFGQEFGYFKLESGQIASPKVTLTLDGYCNRKGATIDKANCVAGVALHEFGHISGLRHEHIRNEATRDPFCQRAPSVDLNSPNRETLGTTARFEDRPYDQKSIMNYCYMDAYELGHIKIAKVGLSVGDLVTLKALYK